MERDCLGFSHIDLSAALMANWKLPQRLIDAVAAPKQTERLVKLVSADSDTPRILHLADLLAQLVGQRRFDVFPDLMKAGGAYCDLTKGRLMVLVEKLQPQVEQLAQALSLELLTDRNYVDVLVAAHDQMSVLTEQLAGQLRPYRLEDQVYTDLLQEAQELTHAMQEFLQGGRRETTSTEPPRNWMHWHAPHERTQGEQAASATSDDSIGIVALTAPLDRGLAPLPYAATRPEPGACGIEHRRFVGTAGPGNLDADPAAARTGMPGKRRGWNANDSDHGIAAGGHAAGIRTAAGGGARQ